MGIGTVARCYLEVQVSSWAVQWVRPRGESLDVNRLGHEFYHAGISCNAMQRMEWNKENSKENDYSDRRDYAVLWSPH